MLQEDSSDITLFTNQGLHVVAFNYRGYGDSEGTPTPRNIGDDAIHIMRFLRGSPVFAENMGVYGRSVGGIPAAKVGCNDSNIKWLCVDRSFGSLHELSSALVGAFAGLLLRLIFFTQDNLEDYLKSTCSKIICYDPADSIVMQMSSLSNSIAMNAMTKPNLLSLHHHHTQPSAHQIPDPILSNVVKVWDLFLLLWRQRNALSRESTKELLITFLDGSTNGEAAVDQEYVLLSLKRCLVPLQFMNAIGQSVESYLLGGAIGYYVNDNIELPQRKVRIDQLKRFIGALLLWGSLYESFPIRDEEKIIESPINKYSKISRKNDSLFASAATSNHFENEITLKTKAVTYRLCQDWKTHLGEIITSDILCPLTRELVCRVKIFLSDFIDYIIKCKNAMEANQENISLTKVGLVLPLQCGHNGSLSEQELDILTSHLRSSRIVQ